MNSSLAFLGECLACRPCIQLLVLRVTLTKCLEVRVTLIVWATFSGDLTVVSRLASLGL